MKTKNIYLYGMILVTNSFLLKYDYPAPDTYGEILQKYSLPGGETGTCATVLASLGCNVTMDGTYLGTNTYQRIKEFYKDKLVDTSHLYFDETFEGLEDYVFIDKNTRTPFGTFERFYSEPVKRYHKPRKEDILTANIVGLDPWFSPYSEEVSVLCKENHIPYVVIDCPYDSVTHQHSQVNVLSNEFISGTYPNADRTALLEQYTSQTEGLVIFTLGANEIMYGRKGGNVSYFTPYSVPVVSTLGAGDSFKAGCVYALLQHMEDDELVRFASATAACACTSFPLPLNPPTLDKIQSIMLQA